ncbi:MAG: GDYXXLXY domain-containing protein [Planctomycetaceae bacterium]|nr:GDYXXLXY domain-containing protein [Planctomycetaceae bacterium]
MRKLLIICSAVLQVLLLAYIGGQREYVLHTGRTIYLRTVPFDPRDFFRGDYARLNYEISTIDKKYFKDGITIPPDTRESYRKFRGRKIYTVLQVDDSNVASIVYVTDKEPQKDALFIRGRQTYSYENSINVLYGIEAFYVQQGKGREIETRMSDGERTTIEMEVALGTNGIAVLKDYHRSPLSIKAQNLKKKDGILQTCEIVLTNNSDKPVGIIDLPGYNSLKLEIGVVFPGQPVPWTQERKIAKIEDKDVHIIKPFQTYIFPVDFDDSYWKIELPEKTQLSDEPKNPRKMLLYLSVAYESPSKEQCKDLKDADIVWHGKLSTGRLSNYDNDPNLRMLPSFPRF